MNEGILVINKNLQILTINHVAKDIFSIEDEKPLGKKLSELAKDIEKIKIITCIYK